MDSSTYESQLTESLTPFGFRLLGWFRHEGCPSLLIGDTGGSHWQSYSSANSDRPQSMDDWTRSTITPIAESIGVAAYYPFGEPTYPFQQWAKQAMGIHSSPLGLLIHPEFGLWIALRAALVFHSIDFPIPAPTPQPHPCESCPDRPCLTACPVSAFTENAYDVATCRTFISSQTPEGNLCRFEGCRSRLACPIGTQYVYSSPQQSFHMEAFISSPPPHSSIFDDESV